MVVTTLIILNTRVSQNTLFNIMKNFGFTHIINFSIAYYVTAQPKFKVFRLKIKRDLNLFYSHPQPLTNIKNHKYYTKNNFFVIVYFRI